MLTMIMRRVWLAAPILLLSLSAQAQWQSRLHLYAIGGGYEMALQGYAAEVARHARGRAVRIVMVPAAFGDDPVLPEDPAILAEDVAALQAACDTVINRARFPAGCRVDSVPLYLAADAHDQSIVAALSSIALDGIFFNGGDQAFAMRVLAQTPAEAAMDAAAERGVVFGGTSAGAAIESYVMNAGYTETGDATTALQKPSIDMWMGQAPASRGLTFGSRRLVLDQHVYARGRIGRMLNASAQTADLFGHGGLLGLGLDYDTGIAVDDDQSLRTVFGASSAVVVDFRTAHARYAWIGSNEALSARSILTHLLPPNPLLSFDIGQRVPMLDGRRFEWQRPPESRPLRSDSRATLVLGGDVSDDLGGPVIQELVRQARVAYAADGRFLLLAVGYADPSDALNQAAAYASALAAAGWMGGTDVHIYGSEPLDPAWLVGTSGVVMLGGDQSRLQTALADPAFRAFVYRAARDSRVLLLEHAMAAAAGEAYCALGEGASGDDAIAAFQAGSIVVKLGLGLVQHAIFEPRLQTDMRWGRLYGLGSQLRQLRVFGISESSAIMIHGGRATVLGRNPVMALDARSATFFAGDNGMLGAFNVLLDAFEPDEELNR